MKHIFSYWIIGFLFWIVVDYTSTFIPDTARWISHMPFIWIFYIAIPAVMAFVIYRLHFFGKKLFIATLVELVIAELLLFHSQLFTIPVIYFMLPVAIGLYCFLTFMPMWIVEHKIGQNKVNVVILGAVWLFISILHYVQNI